VAARRTLRLGQIGAGRWGRTIIAALSRLGGVRLTRLASTNPESAAIAGPDCAVTPDWHDMIAAADLDGVIVAAPPALHCEMAGAAIDAGIPVFVEKPLTMDLREAEALLDKAAAAGAVVLVDHIHLFSPAWRELKRLGLGLGNIHMIRSAGGDLGPFRIDAPVLWDRAGHDVALVLDLLGAAPETVAANTVERRTTADGDGETVALRLGFAGGVGAEIEASNLYPRKKRFTAVHYDRETLIYDDVAADKLTAEPRPDDARCAAPPARAVPVDPTPPLDAALSAFAAAIRAGTPNIDGLRLGVDVVRVLARAETAILEARR